MHGFAASPQIEFVRMPQLVEVKLLGYTGWMVEMLTWSRPLARRMTGPVSPTSHLGEKDKTGSM
jgi:hypothetical protein